MLGELQERFFLQWIVSIFILFY